MAAPFGFVTCLDAQQPSTKAAGRGCGGPVYPVGAYRRLRGSGSRTPVGRRTPAPRTVECPRRRPGGTRRDRVPAVAPRLADGAWTTLYAVGHPPDRRRAARRAFPHRGAWTSGAPRTTGDEAIIGGFFVATPIARSASSGSTGARADHEPIPPPTPRAGRASRSTARSSLVAREARPSTPSGDLVQAGPLLVAGGEVVFDRKRRPRASGRLRAVRLRHHGGPASPCGARGADRPSGCRL